MVKEEKLKEKINDLAYLTEEIFGLANVFPFVVRDKKVGSLDITDTMNMLIEKVMVLRLKIGEIKSFLE